MVVRVGLEVAGVVFFGGSGGMQWVCGALVVAWKQRRLLDSDLVPWQQEVEHSDG